MGMKMSKLFPLVQHASQFPFGPLMAATRWQEALIPRGCLTLLGFAWDAPFLLFSISAPAPPSAAAAAHLKHVHHVFSCWITPYIHWVGQEAKRQYLFCQSGLAQNRRRPEVKVYTIWPLFLLLPFQWLTFQSLICGWQAMFQFCQSPDIDRVVFWWYISIRFVEC